MALSLFGFSISRKKAEEQADAGQSFAPPATDDGALTITSAAYYGTYVDLDGTAKNEIELISRYREMSMQPELESAIDDIVNEAIVEDDQGKNVKIVLDELKIPEKIKKSIQDEFATVLRLLNFKNMSHDIFRRYYIDGRLFYHIIIDREDPVKGIQELRYIDPRKIRKIRELRKTKDGRTGVEITNLVNEYYIYNDKTVSGTQANFGPIGIRIAKDSIININSGLMDSRRAMVLSYLHKAIKPLNQLRMIEDATVIYRISRAPERRVFYIDVGNLPKLKAEQYLRDIMVKYKNKLVYDANTGEVRDDRKFQSMMEDFWLPRREGGKGTEITTLPGGQNLGELEDVKYFEKKLYKALGVPISRLESSQGFSLGRSSEITRDELKFTKFVSRLRNKFTELFIQALRVQLVLKGVCTEEEFKEFKEDIYFDFLQDNNFSELKEAELMNSRLALLGLVDPYTGHYFSTEWVFKNVLRMDDDEIALVKKQIEKDAKEGKNIPAMTANEVNGQAMIAQIPQPGMEDPEADQGDAPAGGSSGSSTPAKKPAPKPKPMDSGIPIPAGKKPDLKLGEDETENTENLVPLNESRIARIKRAL